MKLTSLTIIRISLSSWTRREERHVQKAERIAELVHERHSNNGQGLNEIRISKWFTKFLPFVHALFLFHASSYAIENTKDKESTSRQTPAAQTKTSFYTIKNKNLKITVKDTVSENLTHSKTISSIWILDKTFPVELVTLPETNRSRNKNSFAFENTDSVVLRSTEDFFPISKIFGTLRDEGECNKDEFKMFARIVQDFKYTGVEVEKNEIDKTVWFAYGNIVCVKILTPEPNEQNSVSLN